MGKTHHKKGKAFKGDTLKRGRKKNNTSGKTHHKKGKALKGDTLKRGRKKNNTSGKTREVLKQQNTTYNLT